ncbi:hypothetical protein PRK78_004914 [Emydomyces testavorans]|uniref:Uncharacterized protein n=1 Tax=Emydomyces testavorans TaxID=2070801 RepID=A0AAF0IJ12_9EURO|nr:hypothetical protein PRK78_004914 [Emydomyces testavorans]
MSSPLLRPSRILSLRGTPRWNCTSSHTLRRGLANLSEDPQGTQSSANLEAAAGAESTPDQTGTDTTNNERKIGYDPERMTRERSSLFELFALSKIPVGNAGLGVKIDALGQLQITDPVKSRQKHKTALVLSAAPISLVERDFRRLLDPGKHIEGWRSDGGLEEIIPVRDPQTLRRKHGWILVFATPSAAQEYQARIHDLRVLLRHHLPLTSESKLQLPPAYTVSGARGFTLQDYTISTPWQYPSVIAHLSPFNEHIQETIDIHNNMRAPKQNGTRFYPVQISVDTRQLSNMSTKHIVQLVQWDAENRGVPWKLAEVQKPITHLTGDSPHKISDLEEGKKTATNGVDNWRIMFENPSEARRFARAWHRRPLPRFTGLPFCDPLPLLHVECLFRDEGF